MPRSSATEFDPSPAAARARDAIVAHPRDVARPRPATVAEVGR